MNIKKKLLSIIVNFILFTSLVIGNDALSISNPSSANDKDRDNYLIAHDTYYISYNDDLHIPNWVGWHVDINDLSTGRYSGTFSIDPNIPSNWIRVSHKDYDNSGFDRGHLCPNADRNAHDLGKETFLTSNIIPQTPECNRGVWKYFEEYCRQIIADDKNVELYVYAGVYGQSRTISKKNICVPAYCWKVVIILPVGDDDLSRISTDTKTIAMWMPNTVDCNNVPFRSYVTTIRYIEKKTGYNFLENVNVEIQDIIENITYSFDE